LAHILLVEDDEGLAYALAASVRAGGHLVTAAPTAFSALPILDSDVPIDLLLTDLVMPPGQLSGLALARMARLKRPSIAVIFMTGHPELEQHIQGDKLLLKPVDGNQILTEITTSLTRSKVIR
jgi:CheY-like chemotaxis protein